MNNLAACSKPDVDLKSSEVRDSSLEEEMTARNVVMTRRIVSWSLCIFAFFAVKLLGASLDGFTAVVASYMPSVQKVYSSSRPMDLLVARYVAVLTPMVMLMAAYLMWGESVRKRVEFGALRMERVGRGKVERLVIMYVLGLPFVGGILFLLFAAPINLPERSHLYGQNVIHLMLRTEFGLLLFGSTAAVAAALLVLIFFFSTTHPLLIAYSRFTTVGNKFSDGEINDRRD